MTLTVVVGSLRMQATLATLDRRPALFRTRP
jgi:hypothetical protein